MGFNYGMKDKSLAAQAIVRKREHEEELRKQDYEKEKKKTKQAEKKLKE